MDFRSAKPPAGRHNFSKVVVKGKTFSVLAVSHVPPAGAPQEDPDRLSRTGDERLDALNAMMPDVHLFPNAPHHVARCTGADVEFLTNLYTRDPKDRDTWPTGERCFRCPECNESVTNVSLVVMAAEWHLKCVPDPRERTLSLVCESRRMPSLRHPKCYRRFANRCTNEWGADSAWDPCPERNVVSFEALPEVAVPTVTKHCFDVIKALNDYDIGLKKYLCDLIRATSNNQRKLMRFTLSEPSTEIPRDNVKVIELRRLGDREAKFKNFAKALEHYDRALEVSKVDAHLTYHRRSQVHQLANRLDKALRDAERCLTVKPDWVKGYQRKAECLLALGGRDRETVVVMTIACDLDPRDEKSARLLARALDLDDVDSNPVYLVDAIANRRYKHLDAFLRLVADRLQNVLMKAPGERAVHDHDEWIVIDEEAGVRVPVPLARRQLHFVVTHSDEVIDALRASACESARRRAEWFADLCRKYVPTAKRMHETMSSTEWDRRRDGLPFDIFRRIALVPAVTRVTRRCAKAKEKQGNPKKKKKKKGKGDDEKESERRPETAKTYDEFVQLADEEQRRKEKASREATMEEQRLKFQSLPPAFESNPMRQYGLSDDYMAQLKRHLSKDRNRPESEIRNWTEIVDRDPDAMTTEELHKYLTQQGMYLMGKLRRENLVEQVKKLRVYDDLCPADRIIKILPEMQHEDGIYVDPNALGRHRLALTKKGKEQFSTLYGIEVIEEEEEEDDFDETDRIPRPYLTLDEFERLGCSFEPNETTLGVPSEMIKSILDAEDKKKYIVTLKQTALPFDQRNRYEAVLKCVKEFEILSDLADMKMSDVSHLDEFRGNGPFEKTTLLKATINSAQAIFRGLMTYDSMSKAEREFLVVSMRKTYGFAFDRDVVDAVIPNVHFTCDEATIVEPLRQVDVNVVEVNRDDAAVQATTTARRCASCGKAETKMKCGRCKSVYYCNRLCQKTDYKRHKSICR